jgi:fructose-bisphosphate aldolase, class I
MKVSDMTIGQSGEQLDRMRGGRGFVVALDQSGGSTPRMLAAYGIEASAYANEVEMFELVHRMRERIIRSPSFDAAKVLATILFQDTLDRTIDGRETAEYVWHEKGIVPFLKVDKGLESEADGVQVLKPIPGLDAVLDWARQVEVFGTKMRSFIKDADPVGIKAIVTQQFEVAGEILASGLVPIIEPEIDIHSAGKARAERLLLAAIVDRLASLPADQQIIVKLSLPEVDDFYADLVHHPRVLRVLALSGGFDRQEAIERLARQHGVIASFSRAFLEGLTVNQNPQEFDATLAESIDAIYQASLT